MRMGRKGVKKITCYFGLTDSLVNHFILGYALISLSCSFVFLPSLSASFKLTNFSNSIIIYLLCSAAPMTIVSFFGLRLISFNKLRSLLLSAMVLVIMLNAVLMLCYTNRWIVGFFVALFVKSALIAIFTPLSDTLINIRFRQDKSAFNRIQSFMMWLNYLGMTIMAFAGAWYSDQFGFLNTIIIQMIIVFCVFVIYCFFNASDPAMSGVDGSATSGARYPTVFNFQVISHLLRSVVSGMLNSLMPIWGFSVLLLSAKEYGFIYSLTGVFVILGGVICNVSFCNNQIARNSRAIFLSSLTIYSILLYIAFIKTSTQWFLVWLCLACLFAMISLITQKILYLRHNTNMSSPELSAFSYSFYQGVGMLIGLVVGMTINSHLGPMHIVYLNSIILIAAGVVLAVPWSWIKTGTLVETDTIMEEGV